MRLSIPTSRPQDTDRFRENVISTLLTKKKTPTSEISKVDVSILGYIVVLTVNPNVPIIFANILSVYFWPTGLSDLCDIYFG